MGHLLTGLAALAWPVTSRVRADWLQHQWISPSFTTSTKKHVMAAHGSREAVRPADWAVLRWRVEQLPIFGTVAAAYGALPVVRRFVKTFDKTDDPAILAYWNAIIVDEPAASSSILWSSAGSSSRRRGAAGMVSPPAVREPESCTGSTNDPSFNISGSITALYWPLGRDTPITPTTTLDNITYPSVNLQTLPVVFGRTAMVLPHFNDTDNFAILAMGAPAGCFEAPNRTRGLNVAPWAEADGNDKVAFDGPPTNSLNQILSSGPMPHLVVMTRVLMARCHR